MTLITCKNGHRYDPSLTSECPECAMLKSHTVPLMDTAADMSYSLPPQEIDPNGAYGGAYPKTLALDMNESSGGPISHIPPAKMPGSEPIIPAGMAVPEVSKPMSKTPTTDYGATQAVDMASGNVIERSAMAITGWLVCIDGPEKGKDYRLHDENNFIGRSARMDVSIASDRTVSEDRHAVITYDSQERKFFFALAGGSSIVRLNGKAVLMTQEIQSGDRLQIGQGTFMFIPFCGENFQWEKEETK